MESDNLKFIGVGLSLVVAIIIGVSLLSGYGQVVYGITNNQTVYNQSVDISSLRNASAAGKNAANENAQVTITKNNITVASAKLINVTDGSAIDTGDYAIYYNTTYILLNITNATTYWYQAYKTTNTTYLEYTWYDRSQYISESLPRQFVHYTSLFLALAIIATVLYYIYRNGWLEGA